MSLRFATISFAPVGFSLLACLVAPCANGQSISIQSNVNGSNAVVTASAGYGGAITSFTYRGQQYVDIQDLGRELQSAAHFNGYGECYNPTEAGNKQRTPSQLLSWSSAGEVLSTSTNMAFWLAPGQTGVCGNGATTAVNTTVHSNYIFEKTVSFGLNGAPNVLNYRVAYNIPEAVNSGIFEALTGYMPRTFQKFYTFDPRTLTLSVLPLTAGGCAPGSTCNYQTLPLITATTNGSNAMGVHSPVPPNGLYGAYLFSSVSKWNCVFVEGALAAGARQSYNCNVAFGTVNEVIDAIRRLAGSPGALVPVFRFFNGDDHFLTANFAEAAAGGGYQFEGTAFRVFAAPQDSDMAVLYRCYAPAGKDHFASGDPNCEGTNFEGQYGYVSTYARVGYEAIYRFYHVAHSDHLITTNYSEAAAAGYAYEGIIGYAPTAN